jgi:hypothetical protein
MYVCYYGAKANWCEDEILNVRVGTKNEEREGSHFVTV